VAQEGPPLGEVCHGSEEAEPLGLYNASSRVRKSVGTACRARAPEAGSPAATRSIGFLIINAVEAGHIRRIFQRYLALGSVRIRAWSQPCHASARRERGFSSPGRRETAVIDVGTRMQSRPGPVRQIVSNTWARWSLTIPPLRLDRQLRGQLQKVRVPAASGLVETLLTVRLEKDRLDLDLLLPGD